jgi:hypothetical protein
MPIFDAIALRRDPTKSSPLVQRFASITPEGKMLYKYLLGIAG